MSKFFMYGSELQELEHLIMLVPNIYQEEVGVFAVQRFRNEEVPSRFEKDYEYIKAYCNSNVSGRVSNKIAGGNINYEETICSCFDRCESHHLYVRVGDLIRNHDRELFLSPKHRSRFQTVCRIQNEAIEKRNPFYLATLFLQTTDGAAKDHIYLDRFYFKKKQIDALQKQMLTLIEDNARQGAVSEEFDEAYRKLSEQINELKQAKLQVVRAQKQAEELC